ncbi:MAG: SigE family RNA polymerase sigma factor [Propionibacteriales bacterium]|nr:SigE family RNA polymerase sigma factor [Propionibacteriales bacterium]
MGTPVDRDDDYTAFATAVTPRLFRTALLMCGDWHLAEDLVQTTLAKLYVAWAKVERSDSSEAYARGTLTKTFLSHKRVRRNSETPTVDAGQLSDATSPAAATADRLALFDALRKLDVVDRAVVVLRYWEDRSVSQTAAEVGLSEGAVRTRASRALARLRLDLTDSSAAAS